MSRNHGQGGALWGGLHAAAHAQQPSSTSEAVLALHICVTTQVTCWGVSGAWVGLVLLPDPGEPRGDPAHRTAVRGHPVAVADGRALAQARRAGYSAPLLAAPGLLSAATSSHHNSHGSCCA